MKKFKVLMFSAILLLAILLRFYQISILPPSLNWDEISLGYNAYSILRTGKDEWGQFLPLSFRAFGDYKLPFYIYLDVPFIAIFGLNEISVRLPSVVSGVGIVLLTFFTLKELTKKIDLALWGMFISAVLPWLFILSRIGLEANVALFLTMISFYLFLLSKKINWLLPLSALFLGLSAFTYNSSRVLIVPFVFLLIFFQYRSIPKKYIFVTVVILISLFSVAFFQAFTLDSEARYRWTTILDEGAITRINQLRGSNHLPSIMNKLIYNKATYFITEASRNYLSHFNPIFLFEKGGSNSQFSVPGKGLLYQVMLPLIILGILQILRQREKWQLFFLGWLLIAPLPPAITRDAPHSLRAIFLTIPLVFIAVLGIDWVKQFLSPKIFYPLTIITILILLTNTYVFWQNYAGDYRNNFSSSWQYGYKQAVEYINQNQADYDRIVITKKYGEPHEFVLFYMQYEPIKYQTDQNLVRYQRSDWFWVDRFDKFEFVNDWEIKDRVSRMKNILLVTSPDNFPANSKLIGSINFLDGGKAFEILKVD